MVFVSFGFDLFSLCVYVYVCVCVCVWMLEGLAV